MVPLTTEKFVSQKVDFNKLHHKLNEKFSNIIEKWKYANKALVSFFKKKLRFTSCKTEQPLRGMELQKKEAQKRL